MKEKIEIPKYCPSCNSILDRVKDQLFCRNPDCGAVANKKVLGFIKVMKIKGLGEKTVEKLDIKDIHDIYYLDPYEAEKIIGEKLTAKLMKEIEKSLVIPVAQFLQAFSIPLIGKTASTKVITNDIGAITYDSLRGNGLGDKSASNLAEWVINDYPYYADLPNSFEVIEEQSFSTQYSACVTGKVPGYTKATITSELAALGVQVTSSVTKKTTHLVCDKPTGSLKEQKAEKLKLPILTYKEFKEELQND